MKPIINPWIFYFANMVDSISIVFIISVMLVGAFCLLCSIDFDECADEQSKKAAIKRLKLCVPIFIILSLLIIFIPSKKTIYEMTIASHITEEKIENSKKTAINSLII